MLLQYEKNALSQLYHPICLTLNSSANETEVHSFTYMQGVQLLLEALDHVRPVRRQLLAVAQAAATLLAQSGATLKEERKYTSQGTNATLLLIPSSKTMCIHTHIGHLLKILDFGGKLLLREAQLRHRLQHRLSLLRH